MGDADRARCSDLGAPRSLCSGPANRSPYGSSTRRSRLGRNAPSPRMPATHAAVKLGFSRRTAADYPSAQGKRLARCASDRQNGDALRARHDLAFLRWANTHERASGEDGLLVARIEGPAAPEDDVDLFLAILDVIV